MQSARVYYAHITLAAIERRQYCVAYEKNLPIYVVSSPSPTGPSFARLWRSLS